MTVVNPTLANFVSSIPTDKIVAVYEGSFDGSTAPDLDGFGLLRYKTVSHGFGRPVFCKSQFSLDGVVWRDENTWSPQDPNKILGIAYSTSSKIYIVANDVLAAGLGTIYYRVVAFWIDNYDGSNPSIPETIDSGSNIYFDSRLNYQKIVDSGKIDIPAATLYTPYTVNHSLGYEPNIRIFNEALSGELWPSTWGGTKNFWLYDLKFVQIEAKIYADKVTFLAAGGASSPASELRYVIYYDEQS